MPGAGIGGETEGPVYTSVQQSRLLGEVKHGTDWIHPDGMGYQILDGEYRLQTGTVVGNWNSSFPTRGDRPATGDLFSVWIDHGRSPTAGTYIYRVVPKVTAEEMEDGQRLNVTVNNRAYIVDLPQGADRGRQVSINREEDE